jgi:hypothetical protein
MQPNKRRLSPTGEAATTIKVHRVSPFFVIPSAVEESLNFKAEIARNVSVRAELAYSLGMTR